MHELSNITPVHWTNFMLPSLSNNFDGNSIKNVANLKKEAESIYKKYVSKATNSDKHKNHSSFHWLSTVLDKGTSGDKIAAMVVFIQEDPIHNLVHLKSLVDMLAKDRRTALEVLQIVKELFLSDLLITDRKLVKFEQQPLASLNGLKTEIKNKYLKLWYFEDELKNIYFNFIKNVERLSKDTILSIRVKSTAILFTLLNGNPEQENYILPCLVNKIGDPSFRIASSAVYLLNKLTQSHPMMKLIIVKEVEQLIYRSNMLPKAQYYAMCFMNGIILSKLDEELAAHLISIYFSFFKAHIKEGEMESKMLSALLVGVNRALPFVKKNKNDFLKQTEVFYKLIRVSKFNISIQALILMYQITTIGENSSNRFYSALYQKLFDPELQHSSKLNIFFNLISKCLKVDNNEKRVQAFIKRLLQICLCLSPSFACCVMLIISHLFQHRPHLRSTNFQIRDFIFQSNDDNMVTNYKGDDDDDYKPTENNSKSSWHHLKNISYRLDKYDSLHRNPMYCRADLEPTFELVQLSKHYHPTIALFANKLLQNEDVVYSGDPLEDFNFRQFLNRFILRNPKKDKNDLSLAKVIRRKKNLKLGNLSNGTKCETLATDDFITKFNEQQVYKKIKKVDVEDSSIESISDSEFDDYLEKFEKGLDGGDVNVEYKGLSDDNLSHDNSGENLSNLPASNDDYNKDLSDEEMDFGDLGDHFQSSDDEDQSLYEETLPNKKRKKDYLLFAAAEEYSHLIDENDSSATKSRDFTYKSNENKKQLEWIKKKKVPTATLR